MPGARLRIRRMLNAWFLLLLGMALAGTAQTAADPGERPGRPAANGPGIASSGMGELLLQAPSLLLEPPPARPDLDVRRPWDHAHRAQAWWGSFDSHLVVHDPGRAPDEPILGSRWQTDEALQVSVAGPLFLFSKVGAG